MTSFTEAITGMFKGNAVKIARGAGNKLLKLDWEENDTVAKVLARAEIKLESDETVTMGKVPVTDLDKTIVQPGDLIVIARKLANG